MLFNGRILSNEQKATVGLFRDMGPQETLVIDAGAGAAKTFTSNAIVSLCTKNENVLVLVYNNIIAKKMADEFPSNVLVSTSHAYARSMLPAYSSTRLERPLTKKAVISVLKLPMSIIGLSANQFASMLLQTLSDYAISDENCIETYVEQLGHTDAITLQLVHYTKLLWDEMTDRHSTLPVMHDVYLKEFVLKVVTGQLALNLDVLVLDEAQDSAPVVKQFFDYVKAKKISVGDKFQSIYEWRGAINVMQTLISAGHKTARLTTCYRYGQEIAELSNDLIEQYYNENPEFKGNANKSSVIYSDNLSHVKHEQELHIFRTNTSLMASVMDYYSQGQKCLVLKGTKEQLMLLNDAERLFNGQRVMHGTFSAFDSWNEFIDYVNTQGGSLKNLYRAIQSYGFKLMKTVLEQSQHHTIDNAGKVFTTAHACKGIEHDHVVLADDFDSIFCKSKNNERLQEVNLLYVALTRAIKTLDISRCDTLRNLYLKKHSVATPLNNDMMENKKAALMALFA
ncbi:3'-5' exonuclease [Vibrio sp. Hal054]|uniref:3'-5' exonuclease n=1 Tax=Vibrio sp. Hal054 TaxID=3035158 RepID=UPI00301BA203